METYRLNEFGRANLGGDVGMVISLREARYTLRHVMGDTRTHIEAHPTGLRIGKTVIAETIHVPTANEISSVMRALRAIPSERRTEASRANGAKGDPESHRRGGRPRTTEQ